MDKYQRMLLDKLMEDKREPSARESAILASLDESDTTKFTPTSTPDFLKEETPAKEEPKAEEKPVEEEKKEEQPVEAEPKVEEKPVEEPKLEEPVEEKKEEAEPEPKEEEKTAEAPVEEKKEEPLEPEVKEEAKPVEEPAPEKEELKSKVVAINDLEKDGKRPQEETTDEVEEKEEGSRADKKVVLALNDLDHKETEEKKEEEPEAKSEEKAEEPKAEGKPVEAEEKKEEAETKAEEKTAEEPAEEKKEEGELTSEEEEERRKLKIRGSISEAVSDAGDSKVPGKFEVYPEDDVFKYRLKANNGEILVVSYGYTTRDGAHAGIETLKKNLSSGLVSYITDKNNRSTWRLNTSNDARIVAMGETYSSLASAQSAFASTQKFGKSDRIIDLDEIDASERREWKFTAESMPEKDSGGIEIYDDGGKFRARLIANNQEVLFVTSQTYATKTALKYSLDNIKTKLNPDAFHLLKDKQGYYQFIMESGSGFVYLVGESYSTSASAKSAAASVLAFIHKASVVDLTLKSSNVDVELTGVKKEEQPKDKE